MIVYIYDDKEGKTNAISIDKKNMVDEDLEFFNDHSIRKVWHSGEEEWYLSIVDVVQVLTDSSDPKQYIKKMRARDKALESKWGTICTPLQMLAPDGKMRKTQAANTEGILRIIQSIPSPKAEPFKTWLAKVGAERLEEIADPEKAMERAVATYKAKGYSDKWISQRLRTIEIRKELTDEWQNAGIKESKEFAALTNILTIAWSGKSVQEYKKLKGLKKENLRDNMTNTELALNLLAEVSATEISRSRQPEGFSQTKEVTIAGGKIAGDARKALEEQLGKVNGTEGGNKLLISVIEAANEYIANNRTAAAEKIVDIDVSELPSDSAKSLYNTISGATFASAASEFYSKAQSEYSKSDYETAAEDYAKAFRCDSTNVNAAYYAAKCYVALSQTDNAKKYYEYIVNDFKTSGYYREADEYVSSH